MTVCMFLGRETMPMTFGRRCDLARLSSRSAVDKSLKKREGKMFRVVGRSRGDINGGITRELGVVSAL